MKCSFAIVGALLALSACAYPASKRPERMSRAEFEWLVAWLEPLGEPLLVDLGCARALRVSLSQPSLIQQYTMCLEGDGSAYAYFSRFDYHSVTDRTSEVPNLDALDAFACLLDSTSSPPRDRQIDGESCRVEVVEGQRYVSAWALGAMPMLDACKEVLMLDRSRLVAAGEPFPAVCATSRSAE